MYNIKNNSLFNVLELPPPGVDNHTAFTCLSAAGCSGLHTVSPSYLNKATTVILVLKKKHVAHQNIQFFSRPAFEV